MIARGYEPRASLIALALVLVLGTGGVASAHAPPQANGILWLDERALVRTNRGLILEDEAPSSFRLLCNDALQASLTEIPPVEVTSDGKLLTATFLTGIELSSDDHCSFDSVTVALEDAIPRGVVADSAGGYYATLIPRDGSASVLAYSGDDGRTFEERAALAGIPTGVMVAPSDPKRVYVGTSVGDGASLAANLATSDDAGRSFEEAPVELLASEFRAYVLGVDPEEPTRVFVRTESRNSAMPERVLLRDGVDGAFETVLETPGPIAMTWGTDGVPWAGGPLGLFRFDDVEGRFVSGTSFDISHVGCLASHAGRLYACGFHENEFGVLASSDDGASFEWFLRFPEVTARLDCPATSDESVNCAAAFEDWSLEQGIGAGFGGQGSSAAGAGGMGGDREPGAGQGPLPSHRVANRGCDLRPAPGAATHGVVPMLIACSALFARRRRRGDGARSNRGNQPVLATQTTQS
jgi:hypothetical protein